MRPRSEVTLHLTKDEYSALKQTIKSVSLGIAMPYTSARLLEVLESAEFDPLLDERVTVGSSFKRGQG